MNILFFNTIWMTYNICLATIAITCGWLFYKLKFLPLKLAFGFLWLLFIPNTLYMLSDIIHFSVQFNQIAETISRDMLVLQYVLFLFLGILMFVVGLYPIERMVEKIKVRNIKINVLFAVFIMNFIIAFGVVIGRVQRTNSWEVFTNTNKVLQDSINVLTSQNLLLLVLFFGILGNVLYFPLRNICIYFVLNLLHKTSLKA